MDQIENIKQMENIYNEVKKIIDSLYKDITKYEKIKSKLEMLNTYYSNGQWLNDYKDDCLGKLPQGLKRGILTEDCLYDLFCEDDEIKNIMEQIIKGN